MNLKTDKTAQIDLSGIVVNWNSLEITSAALASLKEHTSDINYEVFVVDNGTTKDSSVEELPQKFPWITFIANPDNRGFSKANNQGIKAARGRYVLLLNNDTVQIENALEKAVRYMDAHDEVGALGILHLNNDAELSFQPSAYDFPRPGEEILTLLGLNRAEDVTAEANAPLFEKDVDWVCGSFLLMRRECLAEIGALDERFFIYDEDIDWCLQAHKAGWKVRFWPGAKMIHLGATSGPQMRDKTFLHFRSHLSYIRKNHGMITACLYYLTMGLRLTLATIKQSLLFVAGKASSRDLRQSVQRQTQFLILRAGRFGA